MCIGRCKCYAVLYKEFEHLWILVLAEVPGTNLWIPRHGCTLIRVFCFGVFFSLQHFFTFYHHKMLRAHLVYILPQPKNHPLFQESRLFRLSFVSWQTMLETKMWALLLLYICLHFCGNFFSLPYKYSWEFSVANKNEKTPCPYVRQDSICDVFG